MKVLSFMGSILSILFVFSLVGCGSPTNEEEKSSGDTVKVIDSSVVKEDLTVNTIEIPDDMVLIEGGKIILGHDNGEKYSALPFETEIVSFYMDKSPVTVAEFRNFIQVTGYKTEAEKFGDAGVFSLEEKTWSLVPGATWEYPRGPEKPKASDDHPVTQVSWNDALNYADWAGKRLPTEFEWEYAARQGENNENAYPWGNELVVEGEYMANYWQGDLSTSQGKDGFVYTSPVGTYGTYKNGLTDMSGNVWEWCANTYAPYPGDNQKIRVDPNVKSIRGGSFFYDHAGEESLTVYFRSHNTMETSLFNLGFRCAMDAP
jgi:sulfatase modifying factor 1